MTTHQPSIPDQVMFDINIDTKYLVSITQLSSIGRNTYFMYFYVITHHQYSDEHMMTYHMVNAYRAIVHYGTVHLPVQARDITEHNVFMEISREQAQEGLEVLLEQVHSIIDARQDVDMGL
ncbi:hypothetical protein C8J56DRAFT_1049670 [Mycena floridula]|nr:hypothetical protein C8J56DRAFT_1049670 [Mycena floridula]